jgi:hypothetical protein
MRLRVRAMALVVAIALLAGSASTARAETWGCSQVSSLATVRARWATVRQNDVDPAQNQEKCRLYATTFFEAVTARQAASFCTDGIDRERILESLDSEIEAFNNLIGGCAAGSDLPSSGAG